jgi:hypothetical protein
MANSDNINWIEAGEALNGTGLEDQGQPDTLNRPVKDLLTLFESGAIDAYSNKIAIKVADNNQFAVGVATNDVVMMDQSTGKFVKASPNKFRVVGFADLTNVMIHNMGIKTFTAGSLTKGQIYYLSKSVPGTIVPASSTDKSYVIMGIAITDSKLFVKIDLDVDLIDNSVVMAIVLGS